MIIPLYWKEFADLLTGFYIAYTGEDGATLSRDFIENAIFRLKEAGLRRNLI